MTAPVNLWPVVVGTQARRAALLCALLVISGHALAHAALVKSEPARRATLSKPPQQIRLWFNERLEPAYAKVTLHKDETATVEHAPAQVDKADPKLLVLDLPALAPGTYTVKYRVLSVDGHTLDYGYTFTVKAIAD
jgi:methionine-rich copper-binding protein CopC